MQEKIFKDLPFYKYYNELNNVATDTSGNSFYCKNIKDSDSQKAWIKNLCLKVEKNLIKLSNTTDDKHAEHCLYFTYWFYQKIIENAKSGSSSDCLLHVILKLLNVISTINRNLSKNHCYVHYYSDVSLNEWKEMKDLHDYFKGYEDLKKKIKADNNIKEDYCKYFTYIMNLYKSNINKCCVCISKPKFHCLEKCPEYFKCEKMYYPYEFLSILKCDTEEQHESVEKLFNAITIDYKFINRMSSGLLHFFISDPFYVTTLILFSILGLFLIFFIFLKSTPHGSRLQKGDNKKKEIKQHINEGTNRKKIKYDENFKTPNDNSKRIHISYHRT
ncbi:PIR protein [Plasmodium vivax]|nr:PIR protein [Plasmodium vivax]